MLGGVQNCAETSTDKSLVFEIRSDSLRMGYHCETYLTMDLMFLAVVTSDKDENDGPLRDVVSAVVLMQGKIRWSCK